jgi:hypothetical protein
MNNSRSIKKLIREYTLETLKEYDDGGYVGDFSMYSGGVGYGSGGDLYKVFIQPFADVVGTVAGKTKEIMRSGLTVLNVAFEGLMTTLVPWLTDSYDEIFQKEKADLQAIENEYRQYYDATAAALGTDAKMLAFFAFPGPVLAGKFVSTAPKAAKSILSIATGGLTDKYLGGDSDSKASKSPSSIFDSYAPAYVNLLREKTDETEDSLSNKIGSKKFIDAVIARSPTIKGIEKTSQQIFQKTLGERIKPILEILAVDNVDDLAKILGKKIQKPDFKKLDPEQKLSTQEAEKKFLEGVKKTSIQAAVKEIRQYVDPARKAFGNDHPFVQSYDSVLSAIESGDDKKLESIKKQLGLVA